MKMRNIKKTTALAILVLCSSCGYSDSFAVRVDYSYLRECEVDDVKISRLGIRQQRASGCGATIDYYCPRENGFVSCEPRDINVKMCHQEYVEDLSHKIDDKTYNALSALCSNEFCDLTAGKQCYWAISILNHSLDEKDVNSQAKYSVWLDNVAAAIHQVWLEGALAGVSWNESVGLSLAFLQLDMRRPSPKGDFLSDEFQKLDGFIWDAKPKLSFYDFQELCSECLQQDKHGFDKKFKIDVDTKNLSAIFSINGRKLDNIYIGAPRHQVEQFFSQKEEVFKVEIESVQSELAWTINQCQIQLDFKFDLLKEVVFHCKMFDNDPREYLYFLESIELIFEDFYGPTENKVEAHVQRSLGVQKATEKIAFDDIFYSFNIAEFYTQSTCAKITNNNMDIKISISDSLILKQPFAFCGE